MKNVWILNHHAVPPNIGGGTRHHELSYYLNKKGYKSTIFCSGNIHRRDINLIPPGDTYREENCYGVDYVFIKTRPVYGESGVKRVLNMLSYYFFMVRNFRRFGKPDIVIGSSVHPFAIEAARVIARKTGAKFFCEIRDLWPETLVQMGQISRYHPIVLFFKRMEKKFYHTAEKIIVLLPNAYEYIKRYHIPAEKVVCIPNGVDVEGFDRLKEKAIPLGIDRALGQGFCCVYIGAHGMANSLETLILSAELVQKEAPSVTYIFIGDGPEKKSMQQLAEERGLKNVLFFDPVKKEEVPAILSRASINLVAMKDLELYKYGISLNKLFDYMCSGKPVVFAGNVYNDLVKMSGCGISVPADDFRGFAEAIIKLFHMSERERAEWGEKGKAYVQEHHNMIKLADRLEELF